MTTSIRISEKDKRALDALQAKIVLATGKKMLQQELLDMLLKFSAEQEELVKFIAGVKLPLPSEEVEKLMKLPTDWEVETKEKEIDEYLYGRKGGKLA